MNKGADWGARKYMTRAECERVILRLMGDGRAMTISEIREVTGCHRDTIGGIVKGPKFEPVGKRPASRAYKGGSLSTLYRLRTESLPKPLSQPTNPIIDAALADNGVLIQAVRVLARRGHRAAAVQVATIWQVEDSRLKHIFEGRGIEDEQTNHRTGIDERTNGSDQPRRVGW